MNNAPEKKIRVMQDIIPPSYEVKVECAPLFTWWCLHKKKIIFILILIPVIAIGLIGFSTKRSAKADVSVFYPKVCLGDWTNVLGAEGKPEVSTDPSSNTFTTENSAVLANKNADIFCGAFEGEIPPNSVPQKVVLKLSWTLTPDVPITHEPIVVEGEEGTSTETVRAILDATTTDAVEIHLTNPEPAPEPSPEPVVEPTSLPEAPILESEPTSFFDSFIEKAFAEEVEEAVPVAEALLQVEFTLDGTTWHTLGVVTRDTLAGASFVIPQADVSKWEDLSRLQIKVSRLLSTAADTVYLDGMSLEVEYDDEVESDASRVIDPKLLHVTAKNPDTADIQIVVHDNGGQEEVMVSAQSGTNIRIYSTDDVSFSFIMGIGSDTVVMPIYFFGPGSFIIVDTKEKDACSSLTLSDCRDDPGYLSEVALTIGVKIPDVELVATSTEATSIEPAPIVPEFFATSTFATATDAILEATTTIP